MIAPRSTGGAFGGRMASASWPSAVFIGPPGVVVEILLPTSTTTALLLSSTLHGVKKIGAFGGVRSVAGVPYGSLNSAPEHPLSA